MSLDLDLDLRQGLPEELRFLVGQYPREAWPEHPNLGELSRFWLGIHEAFREQSAELQAETLRFREGKIARVDDWLRGLGAQSRDFERVTFYSDSTNDLPLLERVSHPVATNPSASLAQIAAERGWPQLQLFA